MNDLTVLLPLMAAVGVPMLGGVVWLVRLEGKVDLNRQRIDEQATNMNIMMETIKEMRKELQTLNSNVMWMRGRLQGEHHMPEQHQE